MHDMISTMDTVIKNLEPYRGKRGASLWLKDFSAEGMMAVKRTCPSDKRENRITLARFYHWCEAQYEGDLRRLFNREIVYKRCKALPQIIRQDAFLHHFAEGIALRMSEVIAIVDHLTHKPLGQRLKPIKVLWNDQSKGYHAVVGAPPTFLSKFIRRVRLQKDHILLNKISQDLAKLVHVEDHDTRRYLTMAILAHGAVYRELEGAELQIPSFEQMGKLITYRCMQHLIDEGVKTVSLAPIEGDGPGLYLCQGTELWPSQRATLGSILANFATHGSATGAYAHSWRRIHKHLRDLTTKKYGPPIVAGHSMGGALAIQITLYSHDLIRQSYAFNPPLPSNRDEEFFRALSEQLQQKLEIHANLDDFAFWRIGEKVFGQVTIWLALTRFRYLPIGLIDSLLVLPAIIKLIHNLTEAFPAHQNLFALESLSVAMPLTPQEIAIENKERLSRFDYLRFFPKLYDPMRTLIRWCRRLFGWSIEKEYLQNEFEIILLHEQDLLDSLSSSNRKEIHRELLALKKQRERILKQLAEIK